MGVLQAGIVKQARSERTYEGKVVKALVKLTEVRTSRSGWVFWNFESVSFVVTLLGAPFSCSPLLINNGERICGCDRHLVGCNSPKLRIT